MYDIPCHIPSHITLIRGCEAPPVHICSMEILASPKTIQCTHTTFGVECRNQVAELYSQSQVAD